MYMADLSTLPFIIVYIFFSRIYKPVLKSTKGLNNCESLVFFHYWTSTRIKFYLTLHVRKWFGPLSISKRHELKNNFLVGFNSTQEFSISIFFQSYIDLYVGTMIWPHIDLRTWKGFCVTTHDPQWKKNKQLGLASESKFLILM